MVRNWVTLLVLCLSPIEASEIQKKTFDDAKSFAKEQLKLAKQEFQKKLENEKLKAFSDDEILIFASFSLPDNIWLELSQEANEFGARIIVRGLPENSFKKFSSRLYTLQKRGMSASVDIDPELFQKYGITKVPSFVVKDTKGFDKVSGSISLEYFLEKSAKDGDSLLSKYAVEKRREN